jgi:large subunit ribosomal protein L24
MAMKIRKGDRVIVTTGRERGRQGEVLRVLTDTERVVVAGVNMIKRHTKPRTGQPGGIVEKEAAIHISNVAHIDPKDNKPTRVGFKVIEGDRKVRYAKRSGEIIDR